MNINLKMKINMKRKLICLIAMLAGCMAVVNAQSVQTLVLKNGSEMDGYISAQRPGVDFTFAASRAIVYVDPTTIKDIKDHNIIITELSEEWKTWAENNDAFVGIGDNRVLKLSDIEKTDGSMISGVRVLERGGRVKYMEIAPKAYSLKWDDISLVKSQKRLRAQLTGMDRRYKLDDGREFVGQYAEEIPGKTVCLYSDNGYVEVIPLNKVVKEMRVKINPNQTLLEQNEYVDIVVSKDGSISRGVIIERNYDKNLSASYLLLQTYESSIISLKLSDVIEYRKEQNEQFAPVYDVLLREGEFMVNRNEIKCIESEIDELSKIVAFKKQEQHNVVIEYTEPLTTITVETCFADSVDKDYIMLVEVKDSFETDQTTILYDGFRYDEINTISIKPREVSISKNNTTKLIYNIYNDGLYAIYNVATKQVYPFEVK